MYMKINMFLGIVALALSALIFYGFYQCAQADYLAFTAGAAMLFSLVPALALYFEGKERMTIMFRTASGIAFFAFLILNVLLVCFNACESKTVIFNGFVLIIEALSLYGIYNAAKSDDLI